MKMRFVFVLSLAAFLNPISVFASGASSHRDPAASEIRPAASARLCGKWKAKELPGDAPVHSRRAVTTKGRTVGRAN